MSLPFPPSSVYLRPFRTQTTPSVHPAQSVKPYGGGSVVVVVALIIFYSPLPLLSFFPPFRANNNRIYV